MSNSAETRRRFPVDVKIRSFGWQIFSRPNTGEPLWKRGDVILPQSKVLRRINQECKELER